MWWIFLFVFVSDSTGQEPLSRGVCGAKAGDVPLTHDMLLEGELSYRSATCIGATFSRKTNSGGSRDNLEIFSFSSLPELVSIDASAFPVWGIGSVNFTGSFPKLRTIGDGAFGRSSRNYFDMADLDSLVSIGESAFAGSRFVRLKGTGEVSDGD